MEFLYANRWRTWGKCKGSEADADTADLLCGSDWIVVAEQGWFWRKKKAEAFGLQPV
ncbi:MAG: hypothetical protein ACYSYT_04160 [Planctomycetota bacterium]